MQKSFFFTGIFSAALVFTALPLYSQAPAAPGGRGAMPSPTNLQVLPKDISHEDLIKTMRGFTGGLGVHCTFCHTMGDFASDAKPEKQIARTMLRMTQEINEKYLSQVNVADAQPEQKLVTCGTCHGGHEIPAAFVPPPEPEHRMPPAGGPPKA